MLREDGDGVFCIGQASHAWLSGQLALAWGNGAFPRPEPWEEVVLAATQHDIGMAEWDLAPSLNASTGWPCAFTEMPREVHLSLWSTSASKVLAQSAYAALLVSMHGSALYGLHDVSSFGPHVRKLVARFLVGQQELQERLLGSLGADRAAVAVNQRLIRTWDLLSLGVCVPWCVPGRELALEAVPGHDGPVDIRVRALDGERFTVAPWPFAAPSVEVRCEGRRLSKRFADERALWAALERAPAETLRFELSASRSGS